MSVEDFLRNSSQGISDVLKGASSTEMNELFPPLIQSTEESIENALNNNNNNKPAKKRGRKKKGESNPPTPTQTPNLEDFADIYNEEPAPKRYKNDNVGNKMIQEIDETILGDTNIKKDNLFNIKQRIMAAFIHFPKELINHYPKGCPNLGILNKEGLNQLWSDITSILDAGDEIEYVKQLYVNGCGIIEEFSPKIAQKVPGCASWAFNQGLGSCVRSQCDDPNTLLNKKITRIGLNFVGYMPNNPYMGLAMATYQAMKEVQKYNMEHYYAPKRDIQKEVDTNKI